MRARAPARPATPATGGPLPGEGRSLGFYIGPAPSGTKSLPRRVAERASRPRKAFGRLTAEQAEVIGRGLQAFDIGDDEAELAAVRDELLAELDRVA